MAVDTKRLDELKKSILDTLSQMETVRQKSEAVRWEACALVKHRTNDFNLGTSRIKPKKLYSNVGSDTTNMTVKPDLTALSIARG